MIMNSILLIFTSLCETLLIHYPIIAEKMHLTHLLLLSHSASFFFILFSIISPAYCQNQYYPSDIWITQSPEQTGMQKSLVDSAVALALQSENTIEHDLRAANFKAYAHEPN